LHILSDPKKDFNLCILGVFALEERGGVFQVQSIWSEHGYGPVLYRIAMQLKSPFPLRPNIDGITEQAKRVWEEFYSGKGQDFVHCEFDKDAYPFQERHLRFRYRLKRPELVPPPFEISSDPQRKWLFESILFDLGWRKLKTEISKIY
jgi:hypothetical protein